MEQGWIYSLLRALVVLFIGCVIIFLQGCSGFSDSDDPVASIAFPSANSTITVGDTKMFYCRQLKCITEFVDNNKRFFII